MISSVGGRARAPLCSAHSYTVEMYLPSSTTSWHASSAHATGTAGSGGDGLRSTACVQSISTPTLHPSDTDHYGAIGK